MNTIQQQQVYNFIMSWIQITVRILQAEVYEKEFSHDSIYKEVLCIAKDYDKCYISSCQ